MLPVLSIIHSLPDRVRFHFSVPPRDWNALRRKLLADRRISRADYSRVSHTCVIVYEHKKVELLHILKLIAIAMADEYHRQPVYVRPRESYRFSMLTLFSGATIILAGLTRLSGNRAAGPVLGWTAVGMTAAAVVEHALIEIHRTGTFDPEALSIVYLITSASRRELIRGAFFTWLASFSRHLLHFPHLDGLKLTVVEGVDGVTHARYLDVVASGSIPMASLEGRIA